MQTDADTTIVVASATGIVVGMFVLGVGIPASTTVSSISGTTITISDAATTTAGPGTAVRFSVVSDPDVLGATGGVAFHALLALQIPNHAHSGTTDGHTHTIKNVETSQGAGASVQTLSSGGTADEGTESATDTFTTDAYTGDQPTLDRMHKDLYRGRAAAMSMIPTSTGAAKAVGLVLPELKGKLDGSSIRVPTPNVSVIDLVFDAGRETSVDEVNAAMMAAAAAGPMKGVLTTTDKPLVSMDFNHDPHSSTFALAQTQVVEGKLVRVLSWYDNEWGFASRMSDTAAVMAKLI